MDALGYPLFLLMSKYVGNAFEAAMNNAYVNSAALIAAIGSGVMAVWVSLYGIRMAYGAQGHNMSDFIWRAGKATVIFALIAAGTTENLAIQNLVTNLRDDLVQSITDSNTNYRTQVGTGLSNLDTLQSISSLIDNSNGQDETSALNTVMVIVGQGSPAIVGGVMLLLNEMAVRIGIAVGPLMLFALLFDSTKDLFSAWIRILMASVVSMAILAVVVGHAANLMLVFVAVMGTAKLADASGLVFTDLQVATSQAGFGLMLSALIYTVPTMAARYFGGGMYVSPSNIFSGMRPPGGGSGRAASSGGVPSGANSGTGGIVPGAGGRILTPNLPPGGNRPYPPMGV
jgi:type IV secretion system protein VirB6